MSEPMTYEQAIEKINAIVSSTKAAYSEAVVWRDKQWENEVRAQLSVLYSVCKAVGADYGDLVVGRQ
jgi:hypothetical protein